MEVAHREGEAQAQAPTTPHVLMLPSPGMGHLIPLAEFAKRLVFQHYFTVTFAIPCTAPPSKAQLSILSSLPPAIDHIFLPPVNFDDLPKDPKAKVKIVLSLSRSLHHLRDVFKSMTRNANLVALLVDQFGIDAFDLAREFNVSPYIYFPCAAVTLSLVLHMQKLDETVVEEYRDRQDPIKLPGCMAVYGKDLPDPFQDRKDDCYKIFLHCAKGFRLADGIFLNSFPELEPGSIKALQEDELGRPQVYPVGPLVKVDSSGSDEEGAECLKWLDEQPKGSVLFVCFGSWEALSSKQTIELALGLEMSAQRFLWVARSPSDGVANATSFNVHGQDDPLNFLPEGFVERIKGRGLVVPSWAPQARILSHPSTGGFLSHCGWNSTLESVVNGIPLIAWPLYAEQKINAVILREEIKVAMRPKMKEENGIVVREEIAQVVKSLFDGEDGKRVDAKMKYLKDAAERVLGENGSSARTLSEAVLKWKTKISA